MILSSVLLLACLAGQTVSSSSGLYPRWADDFVKRNSESLPQTPSGWTWVSKAHPAHEVKLRVGLKQGNFDGLVERLYEISNPNHPHYGFHLSKEEAEAFVTPQNSTLDLFDEWLQAHSIAMNSVFLSSAKDWATLTLPVSQASAMLGSEFHVFQHHSGRKVVRTLEYSLPRLLADHIDTIQPTTYFGGTDDNFIQPLHRRSRSGFPPRALDTRASGPTNVSSCAAESIWTPACLRSLYRMDTYVPKSTENKFGVVSYFGDCQNKSDLTRFFEEYRPDAVNSSFEVEIVNNGSYGTSCQGEGTLDVEYSTSLTYPMTNVVHAVGGQPPFAPNEGNPFNTNEPYLDWVMYALNETTLPQTFSTSYADDEQTVPRDYATRVCNSFAQLGARGVSLLFGSGDAGVGAGPSCVSTDSDGTNHTRFVPLFPASCPYVTVVGGTLGFPDEAVGPQNNALFTTGGGFSNYFSRPDYQSASVTAYISELGDTHAGFYNTSGRGYPDIAAQGNNFVTVEEGEDTANSGTSASTPVAAAVIALLNDFLISEGKSPLGFLNPWLYQKGFQGLNDIMNGSNPGCNTDGFSAGVGWDPTTGLGTPDFQKLRELL